MSAADPLWVLGQEEVRMPLTNGEGPIGLIICPSRELARQVMACLALLFRHRQCSNYYCLAGL
jgi:superfamily II DNA/RNA helicase